MENQWSSRPKLLRLFSLYHYPHLGLNSGSYGGWRQFWRESTDCWEVAVTLEAETGLLPWAGYPVFTKTKSSMPVLIPPWSDIDMVTWTCCSSPTDKQEGNEAHSLQLSHACSSQLGSAIHCSLGSSLWSYLDKAAKLLPLALSSLFWPMS